MRYACVAVLLASVIGVSPIAALDEDQVVGGSPARDVVPEEFRFLFWSSEQWARETVGAQRAAYAAALWKGLPYDSISLERGVTGGCLGVCRSSKVTLYRRTTENATTLPDLAGRAELRTVGLDESRQARTSELTGSVNLLTYGNLSYLLHQLRFMDLPNRYDSAQSRYDSSFVTVTVTADGSTKSVTDFGEGRPIELWAIQQTLDSVTTSIQWREK